jgi:hypothetical protein
MRRLTAGKQAKTLIHVLIEEAYSCPIIASYSRSYVFCTESWYSGVAHPHIVFTIFLEYLDSIHLVKKLITQDLRFSRPWLWRMPFSGMWRRVDLVWTDVSEKRIASIFRLQSAATCSLWVLACWFSTLNMEAIKSSETSVHTRSTRRHIPEDGILQGHYYFHKSPPLDPISESLQSMHAQILSKKYFNLLRIQNLYVFISPICAARLLFWLPW